MQFLQIDNDTTLTGLKDMVGARNVDSILSLNSLSRTPNVGAELNSLYETIVSNSEPVTNQRKKSVLNTLTSDSDVFETAALLGEDGWKFMSGISTFPNMLRIPQTIELPDSTKILGGSNQPVSEAIYAKAMKYLDSGLDIDPIIFNEYSSQRASGAGGNVSSGTPFQWFKLPWGEITLYSSFSGEAIDFPVFPEEYEDGRVANYDTMPDMIYQYEPWYIYKGSGPRSISLTFKFHRDMWTGDHRDGKANDLIRFCEANCYADYSGASVVTSTVTLYISGNTYISGVMTEVKPHYYGPIGLDNFPLMVDLSITINEVSAIPLSYSSVRRKKLIG